jgi:hypothetical protein
MALPITITMTLRDGKLVNSGLYDKVKMDTFMEGMKEGEQVECTYELKHDDGSYAQLSKIHASIRALASETGSTFEEMKIVIKQKAGLINGNHVRSFGDCSKEELSACIQTCIEVGDLVSVNLH